MATPRHESAGVAKVKQPKQFVAKVYRQDAAIAEVVQLAHVGQVAGDHAECWQQAKSMTLHPVLQFTEVQNVGQH
jgi:hypothetical protein